MLKVYMGAPRGMCTTLRTVNAELLAFIKQRSTAARHPTGTR